MKRDLCGCGRPRATDEDVERWFDETDATMQDGNVRSYQPGRPLFDGRPDPAWSRELCWTKPGVRCSMRRRWASDLHIGLAREVFAEYVDDLEEFLRGEGAAAWALS